MNAQPFDTLAAANELEAAGVDRNQAEAIAKQLRGVVAPGLDQLVTRADLYKALLASSLGTIATTVGLVTLILGGWGGSVGTIESAASRDAYELTDSSPFSTGGRSCVWRLQHCRPIRLSPPEASPVAAQPGEAKYSPAGATSAALK